MTAPAATYDAIGIGYRDRRRPDPRVAAQIRAALGEARTVVDVGAGTGSYEPDDATVIAVDPSLVMLGQHPGRRRVRAVGERLPFADDQFDAALAVLTIHHWPDPAAGVAELRRVARRQVVLCFDPATEHSIWLVAEYLPGISVPRPRDVTPDAVAAQLDTDRIEVVPVPWDCVDGFLAAYWRRPELYLEPGAGDAISGIALLDPEVRAEGFARLAADLASGAWHRRHADLLDRETMDFGYRLVIGGQ